MKKIVLELTEEDFLYLAFDLYSRGKTVEEYLKRHILEPIGFRKYLNEKGHALYEELLKRVKAIYGDKNIIEIKL